MVPPYLKGGKQMLTERKTVGRNVWDRTPQLMTNSNAKHKRKGWVELPMSLRFLRKYTHLYSQYTPHFRHVL